MRLKCARAPPPVFKRAEGRRVGSFFFFFFALLLSPFSVLAASIIEAATPAYCWFDSQRSKDRGRNCRNRKI
jgi:hypothetical protein